MRGLSLGWKIFVAAMALSAVMVIGNIVTAVTAPPDRWDALQVQFGGRVEADDDLLPAAEFPAATGQVYWFDLQRDRGDPHDMRLWAKLPEAVMNSPEPVLRRIACRFGHEVTRRAAYAGVTRVALFREGLTNDAPLQDMEVTLTGC